MLRRGKSMCKGPVTTESMLNTKTWKKTRAGGSREQGVWGETTGKVRREDHVGA